MTVEIKVDATEINENSETTLIIPSEIDTIDVLRDVKDYLQNKYIRSKSEPKKKEFSDDISF